MVFGRGYCKETRRAQSRRIAWAKSEKEAYRIQSKAMALWRDVYKKRNRKNIKSTCTYIHFMVIYPSVISDGPLLRSVL